ncbi:MAG: DNRLRE domain-containing protein [Bacteroidales bacterium]|nr:DNRLRE domain-containing protein [Bacteroidales bacterium]
MKSLKPKFGLFLFIASLIAVSINAQVVVILQPNAEEGKDARIQNALPNTNMGSSLFFHGHAGTIHGESFIDRCLIEFDLSSIPTDATVLDASLSLYANTTFGGHSTLTGTNACWLERIVNPWVEDEVTWANQPGTTVDNRVTIPFSNESNQDYPDINVTELIKDMIAYPDNSFGMMIRLQVEEQYRSMTFYSSDAANENLRPKLTITYHPGLLVDTCIVLKPDATYGKDARVQSRLPNTNMGNTLFFHAHAGTIDNQPFIDRSFIEFDLSSIPENAYVLKATMSLFACTQFGGHSTLSGTNASWIQRITSPWQEDEITWNDQPAITNTNRVAIPFSTTSDQDYPDILVTRLVRDLLNDSDNGFGFRMCLQVESFYRYMEFYSSDETNPQFHPELSVWYTLNPYVDIFEQSQDNISIYPNPTNGLVNIDLADHPIHSVEIFSAAGKLLIVKTVDQMSRNLSVNLSGYPDGLYFMRFHNEEGTTIKKLLKQ